jgi:hypothetical protein
MSDFLNNYYDLVFWFLKVIGGNPGGYGMGYYIANFLIFVFIQPGLIMLFFILWKIEKKKNRENT